MKDHCHGTELRCQFFTLSSLLFFHSFSSTYSSPWSLLPSMSWEKLSYKMIWIKIRYSLSNHFQFEALLFLTGGNLEIVTNISFFTTEIMHQFCDWSKTIGVVCSSRKQWNALSHLEACNIRTFREHHHVVDYWEYNLAYAQGKVTD